MTTKKKTPTVLQPEFGLLKSNASQQHANSYAKF